MTRLVTRNPKVQVFDSLREHHHVAPVGEHGTAWGLATAVG